MVVQPAPAPRFSATPPAYERAPPTLGQHTADVLRECGLGAAEKKRVSELVRRAIG